MVVGALGVQVAPGQFALQAQAPERHTVSGQAVAIYNLVGRVTVSGGSGSDVAVEVSRHGADGAQLQIETGPIQNHDGQWEALRVIYPADRIIAPDLGSRLRVIYPADRIIAPDLGSRSRTTLKVRPDGTFGDAGRTRGEKVTIAGSGSGMRASADLAITIPEGKRVGVYLAVGEVTVQNVNGDLRVDVAHASVSASGVTGSLNVDTGSGDVDVQTVEGDLSVDTGSGGITVVQVRGDRFSAETGSGGIEGSAITAQSVDVETGSGDVVLRDVTTPRASVETGSGNVTLALTRATDVLTIETGSGDVEIRMPGDLSAQIDFETGSGEIETDFAVTVRRHSRDHVRGQIGDGAGRIQVETGSGDVSLLRD
jgi:hypothetical protein